MNLYVSNLDYEVTDAMLEQEFSAFGTVKNVKIIKDHETGRSRGFGFVEMSSEDEGQLVIQQLHGAHFAGKPLTVTVARPKPQMGQGEFRGGQNQGGGGRGGYQNRGPRNYSPRSQGGGHGQNQGYNNNGGGYQQRSYGGQQNQGYDNQGGGYNSNQGGGQYANNGYNNNSGGGYGQPAPGGYTNTYQPRSDRPKRPFDAKPRPKKTWDDKPARKPLDEGDNTEGRRSKKFDYNEEDDMF
jgi:RNA recognition motif-containing protein